MPLSHCCATHDYYVSRDCYEHLSAHPTRIDVKHERHEKNGFLRLKNEIGESYVTYGPQRNPSNSLDLKELPLIQWSALCRV